MRNGNRTSAVSARRPPQEMPHKHPKEKGIEEGQQVTNALVLQGGGALGAYELGVVKRLYEDPDFTPAIISGVSIGAVNATVLAGSHKATPVETLEELWRRITVPRPPMLPGPAETLIERMIPMFGIHDFFRPRTDYYNCADWTSFCDVEPQRELLEELVDFKWLNTNPDAPLLILTATNISTGNIVVFSNKKYDKKSGEYLPAGDHGITSKHVLASGAIPPGFPMAEIHGEHYWDGGLFNNTPLSPVVESLDRVAKNDIRRIFLVNLYPNVGKIPSNMIEVINRMEELHFSNKMIFDVTQMNRVNAYVHMMTIFDKVLSKLHRLGDHELVNEIRKLDSFQWMMSYNCIDDIVVIQNNEPEPTLPETDFSEETIKRRVSAGFRDTDLKLEELDQIKNGLEAHKKLDEVLDMLKDIELSPKSAELRHRVHRPDGMDHQGVDHY